MKLELVIQNNLPNDDDNFDVFEHYDYCFSFYKGNTISTTKKDVIKHYLFYKNRKNIESEMKSLIKYFHKSNIKLLAPNILYTFNTVARVYTFIE